MLLTAAPWTAETLRRLGEAVAADGVDAHATALSGLAAAALAGGLRPSLVALLTDADVPPAVRERALAHVSARLLSEGRASPLRRLVA